MTLEDSQSQDAPAVVKPRLANSEIRTMNQRKKLRVEPSDDDDDNNDDDEEEEEDGEDSDYQSGQDEPSDVDDSQDSQDSREESQ
ncbi:hypothetical protein BASA81_015072 [Batrachochytrium salamandrivorans]|nr:hypothetical protein BASA81_015072 [Batrachochytrium salamandrivorans]